VEYEEWPLTIITLAINLRLFSPTGGQRILEALQEGTINAEIAIEQYSRPARVTATIGNQISQTIQVGWLTVNVTLTKAEDAITGIMFEFVELARRINLTPGDDLIGVDIDEAPALSF
jgi:hypothetical protein